jgi:uncharacterized protein YbjT (DUF2867 family)
VTVLITGGTGVLGSAVVRQASLAGHSLRLLVRGSSESPRQSTHERVLGDLRTGEGIEAAVAGADAVLHLASDPRRPDIVDVEGTRRLVRAAQTGGVGHIVYVSIVGVDAIPYHYYRCKRQAELILQASNVPYSIVRATQFHAFISRVLAFLARMPIVMPVPAGFVAQPVDVAEVATRLLRCLTAGPSQRITNFGGPEVLRLPDMARKWMTSGRRRKPVIAVPAPGRTAAAFRKGYNVDVNSERGSITWAEWLERETASPWKRTDARIPDA